MVNCILISFYQQLSSLPQYNQISKFTILTFKINKTLEKTPKRISIYFTPIPDRDVLRKMTANLIIKYNKKSRSSLLKTISCPL